MARVKKQIGEKVTLTLDTYTVSRIREVYGEGHLGQIVRVLVIEACCRRPIAGEQLPLIIGGGGKP